MREPGTTSAGPAELFWTARRLGLSGITSSDRRTAPALRSRSRPRKAWTPVGRFLLGVSPIMTNFSRLLRFAWPYRVRFGLSLLCAGLVAVMWGGNISAVYPLLKVLFANQNCQQWIAEQVETTLTEVQVSRARLEELTYLKNLRGPTDPSIPFPYSRSQVGGTGGVGPAAAFPGGQAPGSRERPRHTGPLLDSFDGDIPARIGDAPSPARRSQALRDEPDSPTLEGERFRRIRGPHEPRGEVPHQRIKVAPPLLATAAVGEPLPSPQRVQDAAPADRPGDGRRGPQGHLPVHAGSARR